jgi:transcription elongation factor GreA
MASRLGVGDDRRRALWVSVYRKGAIMKPATESPINPDTILVTARGHERLCRELQQMRLERRQEIAEQLRTARGDGTLEDNPALLTLLGERAHLERRIAEVEAHLARAQIVAPTAEAVVQIGCRVHLRDTASGDNSVYEVVGSVEGDITAGRLSVDSPIGKAILGAPVGEIVPGEAPGGSFTIEIIAVD